MSRITRQLSHGGFRLNSPKLIVVHAMGERIVTADGVYDCVSYLDRVELSAHCLTTPDGDNIRCRTDMERAYHAKDFNVDSLGVEFLVPGDHDYSSFLEAIKHPYVSDEQYQAGLYQIREWLDLYPIERIARHSDLSPERKVDPGDGFPWFELLHDLGVAVDGAV